MAITSGISNLGLKPGVCTSSSRPTNPYEGMMIFETDTNRVLVYDNSSWVMIADTDTPPALQLIKSQTVGTGVSSVTVSNAFSADYDNYRIIWSGGTVSATGQMWIQLGSSTTGYYGSLMYVVFGNNPTAATDINNSRNNWCGGGTANQSGHFSVELFGPNLAGWTKVRNGLYSDGNQFGVYNGEHQVATAYTGFNIGVAGGTMTGGTITVYGFRKA